MNYVFYALLCVFNMLALGPIMICVPPQGTPTPQHSSRRGSQRTQHAARTAATPRYPQGRRQAPADAPTPLKRSVLTPFGGLRPRVPNPGGQVGSSLYPWHLWRLKGAGIVPGHWCTLACSLCGGVCGGGGCGGKHVIVIT